MPVESTLRDQILHACKEEQYTKAADLLVGESKSSVTYEEVVSTLKQIGPHATSAVLVNVSNIYQRNSGNLAMLKAKLHNISSSHTMVSGGKESGEVDLEEIGDAKLDHLISALRSKQKQVIAKTGKPDKSIAQQLSVVIHRKQVAEDKGYGEGFKKKDLKVNETPPPGAKHWFVLPEAAELDKYEDMKLVSGSPIIDVLRERYERHYKTTIMDEIRHSTTLSAEEQFKRKKEIDRERAFISRYKDTSMVEDQDIFVHQVASRFITDQYEIVLPEADSPDGEVRHYQLADGKLVDSFDRETKRHFLKIEGSIPGSFTVSMKRRTDSGRIIDDVYDIVEFRDGRAVNYAYSSKGNVALSADNVRRSVGQANITLEKPRSSRMFGEAPEETQEEVKGGTPPIAPKFEEPKVSEKKEELPPLPKVKTEDKKEEVPDKQVADTDDQKRSGGAVYNKGFLEAQLRTAVAGKNTSKTTIKYLVDQLADAEGRKAEDVAQEFGVEVPSKKVVKKVEIVTKEVPVKKPVKKKEERKEKGNSNELKLIKKELKKTFKPTKSKPTTKGKIQKKPVRGKN